jgi:hypothetical protein
MPLDYGPPQATTVPRYRRVFARLLGYTAILVAISGFVTLNESVVANSLLVAFALVIATVLVRYGNIRL